MRYCYDLGVSREGNASGHAVAQSCPGMSVQSQGWEFPQPELGVAAAKVVVFFLLFFFLISLNRNIRLQQKSAPKRKLFTSSALTQDI